MINLNGALIEKKLNVLSSNNRAFKYADALFETIKGINLNIIFLEDHYFRLMASMRMLRMEIPLHFTMEFFEAEIIKTVKSNFLNNNYRIRFSVYRKGDGKYTPISNEIEYLIEVEQLNVIIKENYSLELFKDYYVYSGLLSTIKTTNKIINVLASIYAKENNFDNCLLLNEKKNVVEVINGNIFLVFGNIIKTPAIYEGCIKGIIRKKIIEVLSKNDIYKIEETEISPFDLQKADEVFITNSIIGIQPVSNYKKMVYGSKVSNEISLILFDLI